MTAAPKVVILALPLMPKSGVYRSTHDLVLAARDLGYGEACGVIKTYEYRAAGLPVLTTPILGAADRGLDHVNVVSRESHAEWISETIRTEGSQRIARKTTTLPKYMTRDDNARRLVQLLELDN
jgi:hypothetical protein